MAFSKSTEHYELGIYSPTDYFTPETDNNSNMEKLDAILYEQSTAAAANEEKLSEMETVQNQQGETIAAHTTTIAALQTTVNADGADIMQAQTDIANSQVDITTLQGRMTTAEQNIEALTGGTDFQDLVQQVSNKLSKQVDELEMLTSSEVKTIENSSNYEQLILTGIYETGESYQKIIELYDMRNVPSNITVNRTIDMNMKNSDYAAVTVSSSTVTVALNGDGITLLISGR